MTGNEYQALAMRTNDGKSTDRVISGVLTCDLKWLHKDAYSCNAESCEDMLHEIRRMRKLISTGRWIVLVSIIYTLWSFVR